MNPVLYFPTDEFADDKSSNYDLAADFLELSALFSKEDQSFSQDIIRTLELAAEAEYDDVDTEVRIREDAAIGAVNRMSTRQRVLSKSYPFELDNDGEVIFFSGDLNDLGQTAYLVSLILSNLKSITPLLGGHDVHPTDAEVDNLRKYFQYFATAAIAAEVGGPAWSFGSPRPDKSGFLRKLSEIWETLKDGEVGADASAPKSPKDDRIDIFAWRRHEDGLPGFLLIAAQVASGKDWNSKSIKGHVIDAFPKRWFKRLPASTMIPYHVIPFTLPDESFRDEVNQFGIVLHRLRVPPRVSEAVDLVQMGVRVEAFHLLGDASQWIQSYVERMKALYVERMRAQ